MAQKTDYASRSDERVLPPEELPAQDPEPLGPPAPRPPKREHPPQGLKRLVKNPIFLFAVIVVALFALWSYSLDRCITLAKQSYSEAKEDSRQQLSEAIADAGYAYGESRYHTSGSVSINVDKMRETAKLEVLNVSTVAYFPSGESGESRYVQADGSGIYTVDLSAGEYICDDTDHYVLVRVPKPELGSIDVKTTPLTGKVNGTSREGVIQGLSDIENASIVIENTFKHYPMYSKMAAEAAEALIPALLRGLNSDIPDLQVAVQFMA